MRPLFIDSFPIDIGQHNFLPIHRTFCNDFAVGAAHKALSPKFDAVAAGRHFVADTICRSNVTAIRDRMTALDCFPRGMLRRAKFLLLAWMPADCR